VVGPSKQASNEVMLVWGSLRLAPIRHKLCLDAIYTDLCRLVVQRQMKI